MDGEDAEEASMKVMTVSRFGGAGRLTAGIETHGWVIR